MGNSPIGLSLCAEDYLNDNIPFKMRIVAPDLWPPLPRPLTREPGGGASIPCCTKPPRLTTGSKSKAGQSSRFRWRSLFSEWYVYLIKCSASLFRSHCTLPPLRLVASKATSSTSCCYREKKEKQFCEIISHHFFCSSTLSDILTKKKSVCVQREPASAIKVSTTQTILETVYKSPTRHHLGLSKSVARVKRLRIYHFYQWFCAKKNGN